MCISAATSSARFVHLQLQREKPGVLRLRMLLSAVHPAAGQGAAVNTTLHIVNAWQLAALRQGSRLKH
jgi:hypothetical protein